MGVGNRDLDQLRQEYRVCKGLEERGGDNQEELLAGRWSKVRGRGRRETWLERWAVTLSRKAPQNDKQEFPSTAALASAGF